MKKYLACDGAGLCACAVVFWTGRRTPSACSLRRRVCTPAGFRSESRKAASEEEAIRILKEAGITPKSGWSADYPLTPALVGEIRDSIVYAVAAGKVRMTRDDALKSFREVTARNGLSVFPAAGEQAEGRAPAPPDLEGYYSATARRR